MARIVPLCNDPKESSSSKIDSKEFSTSREDQPPHPLADGLPVGETTEGSRLSAVTAAGASDGNPAGTSSSAPVPVHDVVANEETNTKDVIVASNADQVRADFPVGLDNVACGVPIIDRPDPPVPACPAVAVENEDKG